MKDVNLGQLVVSVLLSAGFVSGIFALFTKKMWSPESKNDLAKLANDFASQLLNDAKVEREELRLSIRELEGVVTENREIIHRLESLAKEKDKVIGALEERLKIIAEKVRDGRVVTIKDIFGDSAPDGDFDDNNYH